MENSERGFNTGPNDGVIRSGEFNGLVTALRPKTARGVLPIKVFCIGGSGDLGTAVGASGFISSFALGMVRQCNAGTAAKSRLTRAPR